MEKLFEKYLNDINIEKVCVTGPRPHKLWGYDIEFLDNYMSVANSIYGVLLYLKKYNNLTTFISGGAQGVDHLGFYAATKIKEQYNDLSNVLYIPFKGFGWGWKPSTLFSYGKFQSYKEMADDKVWLSDKTTTSNTEFSYLCQLRNERMVDDSDLVLGIYDGNIQDFKTTNNLKGGTLNCLKYAYKKKKNILILNPYNLEYTFVLPEQTLFNLV